LKIAKTTRNERCLLKNSNWILYLNKQDINQSPKNETKEFDFFSSWQSGIGSKLERDFKLTEKLSGFITRRTTKSISGFVDAVASIER